jgi:hypothetical protein
LPASMWKLIARVSAWLLLVALIISVVSGWGITRTGVIYKISFGLIDRGRADAVHRATQVPMMAILLVHVLVNAKVGLSGRFPRAITAVNIILILIGALVLAGAIYMERV